MAYFWIRCENFATNILFFENKQTNKTAKNIEHVSLNLNNYSGAKRKKNFDPRTSAPLMLTMKRTDK